MDLIRRESCAHGRSQPPSWGRGLWAALALTSLGRTGFRKRGSHSFSECFHRFENSKFLCLHSSAIAYFNLNTFLCVQLIRHLYFQSSGRRAGVDGDLGFQLACRPCEGGLGLAGSRPPRDCVGGRGGLQEAPAPLREGTWDHSEGLPAGVGTQTFESWDLTFLFLGSRPGL